MKKNAKTVMPPPGENHNYYVLMILIGVGGVFLGASILYFYMSFLLPAFRQIAPMLIKLAIIIGISTFLVNYFVSIRKSARMVELLKKDVKGLPIDEELWHDAREAALKLPRLSASFSFILWPSATFSLSVIMLMTGDFGWYEAILTTVSGLLVGPLNAMTYFYAIRSVMYRVLKRLSEYPFKPRDVVVPMISLRFKLVFSYICLVICPMLFAVILDRHQGDKFEMKQRREFTQSVLAEAENKWKSTKSIEAVKSVLAKSPDPLVDFSVIDRMGNMISGSLSPEMQQYAFEQIADSQTGMLYLHRFDRFLSYKSLEGADAWVLGVFYRVNSSRGFWVRNWVIIVLLVFLGSFGVFLAVGASRDTIRSVDEMVKVSELVQKGVFTGKGVYLYDDELGLLGEMLNKLVKNMHEQLEISRRMVADIRGAIARLSKENQEVYKVVAMQRVGVQEQTTGLSGAQAVSGQITDAARSIQEKAGSIQDMAGGTNAGCETGRNVLDEASRGMRLIDGSMNEISQTISELTAHFENIVEVLNLIDEINERTNLLALNASLEAVGAGEAGKRFTVVAKEVRRLAEKTMQSTTRIRSLFSNITESNNACVTTIKDGREKVRYELGIMTRLQESLDEIARHANTTSEAVSQIHLMTSQQTSACMQMQETISEVNDAGKEVEEGAGTTEKSMRSLSELASELQRLIEEDAGKTG